MPIQRIISNKLTSWLLTKKVKKHIKDSQCGFRSFNTSILENILPETDGFEAETEILIKAAKSGIKIGFVNITTIYNNSLSKIKPIRAILGFIKVF